MNINKSTERPPSICQRGPYRRKRDHLEDLIRWDVRDFITSSALREDDEWLDEPEDNWAGMDFQDGRFTTYRLSLSFKPETTTTLRVCQGVPFPNTPDRMKNHWWYWFCPECGQRCRFLYTLAHSKTAMCRKCWKLPYQSQSRSAAQRKKEESAVPEIPNMSLVRGEFGDWYVRKGTGLRRYSLPEPPAGWVPPDLLKRYLEQTNKCNKVLEGSIHGR